MLSITFVLLSSQPLPLSKADSLKKVLVERDRQGYEREMAKLALEMFERKSFFVSVGVARVKAIRLGDVGNFLKEAGILSFEWEKGERKVVLSSWARDTIARLGYSPDEVERALERCWKEGLPVVQPYYGVLKLLAEVKAEPQSFSLPSLMAAYLSAYSLALRLGNREEAKVWWEKFERLNKGYSSSPSYLLSYALHERVSRENRISSEGVTRGREVISKKGKEKNKEGEKGKKKEGGEEEAEKIKKIKMKKGRNEGGGVKELGKSPKKKEGKEKKYKMVIPSSKLNPDRIKRYLPPGEEGERLFQELWKHLEGKSMKEAYFEIGKFFVEVAKREYVKRNYFRAKYYLSIARMYGAEDRGLSRRINIALEKKKAEEELSPEAKKVLETLKKDYPEAYAYFLDATKGFSKEEREKILKHLLATGVLSLGEEDFIVAAIKGKVAEIRGE